jgi:hypothetical protein
MCSCRGVQPTDEIDEALGARTLVKGALHRDILPRSATPHKHPHEPQDRSDNVETHRSNSQGKTCATLSGRRRSIDYCRCAKCDCGGSTREAISRLTASPFWMADSPLNCVAAEDASSAE